MSQEESTLKVSMDWAFVVILQVIFQPAITAVLLTVEAEQRSYQADFGGDVVMGCRFQPKLSSPNASLKVTWHRIISGADQEVYRMDNELELLASQDPNYRGRARLLHDELKDGWARLQLSGLRINDSGRYQCSVRTAEGADYTTITLSVKAPYKIVKKYIEKAEEGDEVLLTCQSEGYPNSSVTWQDGNLQTVNSNTTSAPTPDQLFRVTSKIRVRSSDKNNYTCTFANDGQSATFHIPAAYEMPVPPSPSKNDPGIIVLSIALILLFVAVAVVMYRRRKGFNNHSTRNLLVDDQDRPVPAAAATVYKENEEKITIFKEDSNKPPKKRQIQKDSFFQKSLVVSNSITCALHFFLQEVFCARQKNKRLFESSLFEVHVNSIASVLTSAGSTEECLGAFLKARYSDFTLSGDERQHQGAFGTEELPHRLQNNNGQPANLQALLPEAGEILFLEGPPESGKTTVAHILVSCWTKGPAHALLDLSALRLLVYVDCSIAKADLFQEITTQLSLTDDVWTEDELRTVISGSGGALLLLDGYREGNQFLDESLRRFLSERGGCRVLITACPGHCPTLRDTVETGRVFTLQTQIVKY
ncbi:hypothetical protein L3Q82_012696 [Scortum barcoo]|uniref:Uncharacterized protein n=1 Tax=Scortum barcoo TaxID=214431 RepID=A0ACB8W4M6_9TELE|nr:hypothetical protein L3Q82_012696 [Scortum barcoo]